LDIGIFCKISSSCGPHTEALDTEVGIFTSPAYISFPITTQLTSRIPLYNLTVLSSQDFPSSTRLTTKSRDNSLFSAIKNHSQPTYRTPHQIPIMPRLEVSEFLNYLRAFNTKDYSNQHAFYSDDVELMLPDPAIPPLKNSKNIMDHYTRVHADANEYVIPISILSDRGKVFLEMEAYFEYFNKGKAVHDIDVLPGDVVKISTCALYHLDDDNKMRRIRCYLGAAEKLGQIDLKERIKDSQSRAAADIRLYDFWPPQSVL
ncbi:hypothetical protein B0T10DRAFT_585368, partial [Thelonectria olida]